MSFRDAAAELNVTPAALSFQIKSLEQHFGAPLFLRQTRSVSLTTAGAALLPGLSEGFDAFERAWKSAERANAPGSLVVTTGPAFMAKWMAPRIFDFTQKHPEIELRFSASLRLLDFERDGVDVAVRFGYGPYPGRYSHEIGSEWVTPAMTPALAEQYKSPADLARAPLLIDDSIDFLKPRCDWNRWFKAAGIEAGDVRGAHFSNADHAIGAALSGAGVVLGRASLMAREITEGRLVAPFPIGIETTGAKFRFLCLEGQETRPSIMSFRDWLLSEAEAVNPLRQGREIIPSGDIDA